MMGLLFDCLRDFGQGKTQTGFYIQWEGLRCGFPDLARVGPMLVSTL